MVAPLPSLEAVEVRRGGRRLLGPLTLRLAEAGLSVVMGPNGAGKTTLLRLLHGLERPQAGALHWPGGAHDALGRQAFVFQAPILLRRSVLANIAYPLRLAGASRAAARAAAAERAAEAGLGDHLDRPAQALSGGEKQKLALARALIRAPEVLLLDEPCASLDNAATRDIEAMLRRIRAAGTRIVMSTHDLGQARRLADDVIFLHAGRLIEAAPGAAFFAAPRTPEAAAHLRGDLLP